MPNIFTVLLTGAISSVFLAPGLEGQTPAKKTEESATVPADLLRKVQQKDIVDARMCEQLKSW